MMKARSRLKSGRSTNWDPPRLRGEIDQKQAVVEGAVDAVEGAVDDAV